MDIIVSFAHSGLIHGDFNEFNILIKEEMKREIEGDNETETITLTPILIDFPQMVSMDHANAEYYFDRDVNCVKRFFERRFHFTSDEKGPHFTDARKLIGKDGVTRLDVSVEASGFSRKMAKELEAYMKAVGVDGDGDPEAAGGDEEYGVEDEGEDESEGEGEEDVEENGAGRQEEAIEVNGPDLLPGKSKEISLEKLQISEPT